MSQIISTKEEDFLDEDPPLRGQNYTCVSFLSPEDVIKRKDVFLFENFISKFSDDMKELFAGMTAKYPDDIDRFKVIEDRYSYLFKSNQLQDEMNFYITNHPELDKEFHEKNNFQTSVRGVKIRGVFDTLREAEIRAQVLKKIDNKFNIYVATVGCWCPWSPNPDAIGNSHWGESHLNTLMKSYQENQDKKDVFYEERKNELRVLKMKGKLDNDKDPWLERKAVEIVREEPEDLPLPAKENTTDEVSTPQESVKNSST